MVGSSPLYEMVLKQNAYVMSTGSGKPFVANSLGDLLHQIVGDVLEVPLYWAKTVQNVLSDLDTENVTLTAFGPTNVTKSLRRALETAGVKISETGHATQSQGDNLRGGSGHVAIVGMSGRFPGGKDLEQFWKEVLEKGLDTHSKVVLPTFSVYSPR